MSTKTDLTVTSVGLDNTGLSVLNVAVNLLKKHQIQATLLQPEDTNGQIIIVDLDNPVGKTFYQQFQSAGKRQLIILSDKIVNDTRHLVLRKPVLVQTLKDLLIETVKQPSNRTFTSPPLTVTSATSSPTNCVTSMETSNLSTQQRPVAAVDSLFHVLRKARTEGQIIQVFYSPHPPLFINSKQGVIATSCNREVLYKIIFNQYNSVRYQILTDADFQILSSGKQILALERVLWCATLYGSQAELIGDISPTTPVRLKAWPNLSRLECEPVHIQLSALLASQTLSLKQVEEKTGLEWGIIVGFYNAVALAGLIDVHATTVGNTNVAYKTQPKKRLFNRILQRLKLQPTIPAI
ncbi:hypothetical protein [Beggiatoa leptomitoformis]|uniref:Uncharacterized protein n=1 Tax=Beggiatoa leptomitoformis TaxID=288004 RepID=A0A2N9YIN9_9GAMM|nr:hypothetical protein [Beggiatoa leptomitoformis]ALG67410.1 hypothetical protein AL038_06470 [Beggiatoa leptomitoformis]AUI70377.1 hypothetical protein BLE401_17835 [Beggiatoa leptomitoformis]